MKEITCTFQNPWGMFVKWTLCKRKDNGELYIWEQNYWDEEFTQLAGERFMDPITLIFWEREVYKKMMAVWQKDQKEEPITV